MCSLVSVFAARSDTNLPVLSGLSKIDETKVLKSCGSFVQVKSAAVLDETKVLKSYGSFMQVKSTAENCSILQYF